MSAQQIITQHLDIWTAAHKTRSSAGRGSSNKLDLYGIKKLRELILELAVRGKLVPQDPNDEPAIELLKKIAAERAKQIKNVKLFPAVEEDEWEFELPYGWQWVRLGNVINFINGYAFKSSDFTNQGIGIVKIGDIQDGALTPDTMSRVDPLVVANVDNSLRVEKGDLLIAMSGATTGKLGFNTTDECFYLNQRVGKIFPYLIDPKYLYFPLTTKIAENLAKSLGSAIPNLSTAQINDIVFALPPLAEQHRIVAKVDELMAFCDQLEQTQSDNIAAHAQLVEALLATLTNSSNHSELQNNWQRIAAHFDTLFTTEHSIDQLKQTILQLAVMGKLVPQNPNDEPASVLLKKIAAEKAQLIKDGKIKKEKPLPEITDEEKPFELPSGWEWAHLIDCGVCSTGGTPKTSDSGAFGGNVPFIGPGQITPTGMLLEADKFLTEAGCLSSTVCESGDILMVCIGGSIGKSLVSNSRLAFNQQINCIKPIHVQSKYLNSMMNTVSFQSELLSKSTGSATPIINRSKWEELLVAIPPLDEQHRIVAKVEELMTLCDTLKTNLQYAQTTQLALADALVESVIGVSHSSSAPVKNEELSMEIKTSLELVSNVQLKTDAVLANIISAEAGSIDAKRLWQKSKLDLPSFYKQLKKEISAGYILKPAVAVIQ